MNINIKDLFEFLDLDCIILNYDEKSGISSSQIKSKIGNVLHLIEDTEINMISDDITGVNTIVFHNKENSGEIIHIIFMP